MVLGATLLRDSAAADADTSLLGTDLVATTTDSGKREGTPRIEGAQEQWPVLDSSFVSVNSKSSDRARSLRVYTPPPTDVAEVPLVDGRPAQDADEIVIEQATATMLEVDTGDTLTVATSARGGEREDVALKVVGVTEPLDSALLATGPPRILVTSANAKSVLGAELEDVATSWHASVPAKADPEEVAAAASMEHLDVLTARASRVELEQSAAGGFSAFGPVVAAFIAISLLTSLLVVANTLSVTIAQRTRDLALLRTLGATRGQVAAVVGKESLLVALLGSVLGTVLGHVVVQGALLVAPHLGWTPRAAAAPIGILSVVLPLVAGLVVVMCAGLLPLRRATQVAPLEALRVVPPGKGPGLLRAVLTAVGVLAGGGLMAAGVVVSSRGAAGPAIALGVAGGALTLFSVLLAMRVVVAPLVRLLGGTVGRLGRVPARVAVANVRRHPGRSASTAAALLIGTTLMSMLAVGAQTADASLTRALAERAPVDAVIRAPELPQEAVAELTAIQGVHRAEAVPAGEITVDGSDELTVYGPTAEQLEQTAVREDLASVADGELVIGSDRAQSVGLHDGETIEVPRSGSGSEELVVRIDGNLKLTLVSASTFEGIFGEIQPSSVFVDFADPGSSARAGTDVFTIVGDLNGVLASTLPEARMDSEGATREVAQQIITLMLGITSGLLAVAVVVSLVGVANTLTLGVVERTGENALLRALGTTRRQMRTMLAWEGTLLSVVGALLGVVVGAVCGVLGAMVVLAARFPVVISIPWEQLAAVLVLTVFAGVLASVLPGRRAARTAPARAVADAL
ncbi:FtsX-like permease family protein [Brachybacterium sacelli]